MSERYVIKRLPVVSREGYVVRAASGRRVLHLGCAASPFTLHQIASGTLLHASVTKVARECVGVDLDASALASLERHGFGNLVQADVEALTHVKLGEPFELIIAGELLEHLSNPGRCLDGLRPVLAPRGEILITVPNAFGLKALLRVAAGIELVHQDHVCYFSVRTLARLCEAHAFECTVVAFYSHQPRGRWKRTVEAATFGVARALAPQLSDGLIARVHSALS
jgi:2-polyprenyl-3-methyl-5-hydroxy-6-metoxy-1,4-benzoquinol methylase